MVCLDYTYFFFFVNDKQQALGWQIAKQVSGFNLTLSNNNNYKLKKNEVFHLQ